MENENNVNEQKRSKDTSSFIYLPKSRIYVSKERKNLWTSWFSSHEYLQEDNEFTPTIPQFIEFLNHLRSHPTNQEYQNIYNEITQFRNPWRSEWLDAEFKIIGSNIGVINYNHLFENRKLIPKNTEIISKNTLMEDRTSGISLDTYLSKNHTKQGLPTKKVESGDLNYCYPGKYGELVARFGVSKELDIGFGTHPSARGADIGVRAVRKELPEF